MSVQGGVGAAGDLHRATLPLTRVYTSTLQHPPDEFMVSGLL